MADGHLEAIEGIIGADSAGIFAAISEADFDFEWSLKVAKFNENYWNILSVVRIFSGEGRGVSVSGIFGRNCKLVGRSLRC
jgi:hypothetical protein